MCEGLGMEGGRGRAVAGSWLAWSFSQRKLDSAWQTPSSRTAVMFFHEDIKEKIWNHLSKMVHSLLTYFVWPASHLRTNGSHKGRASLIPRQSTHAQTGLGSRFPSVLCDSSPVAVFLKSSGSSFFGHKELIKIFYITTIYIILLLFWILS